MAALVIFQRAVWALGALLGLCYLYQTVYLFLPLIKRRQRPPLPAAGPRTRFAVLIPARNEQAVLPHLLDSIAAQDYPADMVSVFVLADNCTDGTAACARARGARVWERRDAAHVGKGYALEALLEHMRTAGLLDRFDAFLVFDADGLLAPGYLAAMDRTFAEEGFQAACGFRGSKNLWDSWVSAGSGLWYLHDSAHLNASRMALGVTCAVSGTGFGFTRALLERMGGWPFHTLTEDIEFDTWCAVNAVRIGYCPQAVVWDEQPVTFAQSWRQRTRWVQGGVQVSLLYVRRLLAGLRRGTVRERWGCFENLTLTLYGYGACGLLGGMGAGAALLAGGSAGILRGLALGLGSMWLGMLAVGVMTLLTAGRRAPGTAGQKIRGCLAFPLFMLTYIPLALWALLSPRRWEPISHTVAVGVERMTNL